MTDSMTDPHQEAAALARAGAGVSAAVEALADVRARRSTFATAEAFDSAMLEAAWNILAARSAAALVRAEAGVSVSVDALLDAWEAQEHPSIDAAIQTALAARSAGSGSRVEARCAGCEEAEDHPSHRTEYRALDFHRFVPIDEGDDR